ncbi:MAG: ferritin-like domain-containing protein [Thermoproteota archaeon]|nr:ferritin-like domain-containing protein [Thermoproteota archaeon]
MAQNTSSGVNSKLVEYFNEMLSVENAAIDRLQSRIEECPIQEVKARLQQHLEETRGQQGRLQEIVAKYGGSPTDSKAHLSAPKPPATELMKKTIKDTVKSVTGDTDNPLPEEMELIRTKEDAILENAEIIGYKMVMQIAQRAGAQETIPVLEQNMKEEQSMANWIMDNSPKVLDQLWPKIQAAA